MRVFGKLSGCRTRISVEFSPRTEPQSIFSSFGRLSGAPFPLEKGVLERPSLRGRAQSVPRATLERP